MWSVLFGVVASSNSKYLIFLRIGNVSYSILSPLIYVFTCASSSSCIRPLWTTPSLVTLCFCLSTNHSFPGETNFHPLSLSFSFLFWTLFHFQSTNINDFKCLKFIWIFDLKRGYWLIYHAINWKKGLRQNFTIAHLLKMCFEWKTIRWYIYAN